MHITQFTDYALRVLIFMGNKPEKTTIDEIAQYFDLSKSHLMKVAAKLTSLGYLQSIRGKGGGLLLAKRPEDIVLGTLFLQIEPMQLVECQKENNRCILAPQCKLNHVLHQASNQFIQTLSHHTLADIL
jgi:Rrf2 family nitric oxide-sensitive transcriptional repressor